MIFKGEDRRTPHFRRSWGRRGGLTGRQREVLQFFADGLINKQVAIELHLSEETVKTHARHIRETLEAATTAHAVAIGLRKGIIH